jgi:hypothetical protein
MEEIAFSVVTSGESTMSAIGVALALIGFVTALLMRRANTWQLFRTEYFAYSSWTLAGSTLFGFAWLLTIPAANFGLLWLLVVFVFGGVVLSGFVYGVLSHARSTNAFGDGRFAWLGFVPIANLYLLFKSPLSGSNNTPQVKHRFFWLVFGFVGLVLGNVLPVISDRIIDSASAEWEAHPSIQAKSTGALIHNQGLQNVLALMASEVKPQVIDYATKLLRAEADADTLSYIYEVNDSIKVLSSSIGTNLQKNWCSNPPLRETLSSGAVIRHIYLAESGEEIGSFELQENVCNNETSKAKPIGNNGVVDEDEAVILNGPGAGMYRALKAYFPEEAKNYRTKFSQISSNSQSVEEAFAKMNVFGTELRQRLAPYLRSAPDQALKSVLHAQIQIVRQYSDDPAVCNRLVIYGSSAIDLEAVRSRLQVFDDGAQLLYRAMYEGKLSPIQRLPAMEEHWELAVEAYIQAGGSYEELEAISNPDVQDRGLCSATLRYLAAIAEANFPGADRTRAETVAAINGG